jgi:hypothetical protein
MFITKKRCLAITWPLFISSKRFSGHYLSASNLAFHGAMAESQGTVPRLGQAAGIKGFSPTGPDKRIRGKRGPGTYALQEAATAAERDHSEALTKQSPLIAECQSPYPEERWENLMKVKEPASFH